MELKKMFATIDCRKLISVVLAGFVLVVLSVTQTLGQTSTRFWFDNSGSFSTEATLLKINSATVTLKKTNQVVIEVPFSRLSQADLDFVKSEIQRLNGVDPKPVTQQRAAQLPASPSVSPRKSAQVAEANIQPAARHSPQPVDFEPEPVDAVAPVMPDAIATTVPTKDTVTSPPSNVARLAPPNLPNKDFSLGHQGPKKPPIMLKSPPQLAAAKKQAESFLEIESTVAESNPEMASYEASLSANELRNNSTLPPTKDVSTSSANDLRSQSTQLSAQPIPKENQFQPKSPSNGESNEFEAVMSARTDTLATDFANETLAAKDPVIVILDNENSPAASESSAEPEVTSIKKIDSAKNDFQESLAGFSFEAGPDEAKNVFSRPPTFGPQQALFDDPADSEPTTANQATSNLPPRYKNLARKISKGDRRTVHSALLEVQNTWPSQRYPALVEVIRERTTDPQSATRALAIETLAIGDPKESLSHILNGIEDSSIIVREATHGLIENLTDTRIIPALIERLDSAQQIRVARTLAKLGPDVEPHVIALLNHESMNVQLTACDLLGSVGSDKGIKVLQSLIATSQRARIRLQASNAIQHIKRRLESTR